MCAAKGAPNIAKIYCVSPYLYMTLNFASYINLPWRINVVAFTVSVLMCCEKKSIASAL
jgi:hypothetical protein